MDDASRPRKVAVATMVRFAYRSVFGRLGLILDLGWIMLLVLLAVQILPDVLLPGRHGGAETQFDALDYAQALISLLALTAFAVRWHQLLLVGDPHRQPTAAFFRGWSRFLIYGCIVYALIGSIAAVAGATMSRMTGSTATEALVAVAALIVGVLVALATVRCGLVFPAAASGKPISLVAAWRLLRGNSWRLVLASILTTLPVTVAVTILAATLLSLGAETGANLMADRPLGFTILAGLLATISDILLVALGASLLSGIYRELVARRGNGGDNPA
ncbi:MAG TPA: hypothetical protein VH020_14290 [Stellaceae bacterium]|nr:hypothetical protein [Stellaceae bacterium]